MFQKNPLFSAEKIALLKLSPLAMTSKVGPFPTEVVLVFECLVIQQVLYAVYTEQVYCVCTFLASTMNYIIIAKYHSTTLWGYLVISIVLNTRALSLCLMMSEVDTMANQVLCMCSQHNCD